jgi:hypothetical protein
VPLSIGAGLASSYFENPEKPTQPATPVDSELDTQPAAPANILGAMGQQAAGYAPQQPRWDTGLSPSDRFSVLNQAQKMGTVAPTAENQLYKPPVKQPEYPDIRKFMKNPPPPGEYVSSPIPIWQAGFKQHDMNMPTTKQQGYGPIGDFVKQLIFQIGLPMFGMRNPMHPDFSKLYGSLENNEAYKLKVPQTFNYY